MRAALHGAGLDSERLVDVAVEPLESGTTSRARVRLTWAAELEPTEARPAAATDAGRPASVFVKLPADGTGARLFGTLIGLGANEVGFYSAIRPLSTCPHRAATWRSGDGVAGSHWSSKTWPRRACTSPPWQTGARPTMPSP